MAERVVLLSIPQLRHRDVTPGGLASLEALEVRGGLIELVPAFPGLAASSFATLITGVGPQQHGLIGNTYFDRARGCVVAGPFPDAATEAPRLWQQLRAARPGSKTLLWFAPNSRGADVELGAWIERDGTLMTNPPALADALIARFGPFPQVDDPGKGEPPRLAATAWMLRSAAWVIAAEDPTLAIVRVPYLAQVARRFGPDGREAGRAIRELEAVLAPFLAARRPEDLILAATESVVTPVSGPVLPNLVLRGLGLLALSPDPAGGLDVDLARSAAFALADHQLCQIYLNDPTEAATVASAFAGPHGDGIATIAPGDRRAALGLAHPRAGDVILVAQPDHWFAPDWWLVPSEAPRTVPGCGLAPASPGVPIDPAHVKGSLGAPPPGPEYLGILVSSRSEPLAGHSYLAAREVAAAVLGALGS